MAVSILFASHSFAHPTNSFPGLFYYARLGHWVSSLAKLFSGSFHVFAMRHKFYVERIAASLVVTNNVVKFESVVSRIFGNISGKQRVHQSVYFVLFAIIKKLSVSARTKFARPVPATGNRINLYVFQKSLGFFRRQFLSKVYNHFWCHGTMIPQNTDLHKWDKAIHPLSWLVDKFAPVPGWE
jgi:hypothetical protein